MKVKTKKDTKNFVKDIVEIDIKKDIDYYINDFYFSKDDLKNIEIPDDLDEIIEECFKNTKKTKKSRILNFIIDVLLLIVVVVPIAGVINPKLFINVDKVYPALIRMHEFFTYENIASLMGANENSGELKNAEPVIFLKEDEVKEPRTKRQELDLIHSLANSLIKAERKWEGSEVTPNTIKKALDGIKYLDDEYDRIYFRSNLEMWQEGDFSNAVDVHNKVWDILDGSVGQAYAVDEDKVKEIKEKYFK